MGNISGYPVPERNVLGSATLKERAKITPPGLYLLTVLNQKIFGFADHAILLDISNSLDLFDKKAPREVVIHLPNPSYDVGEGDQIFTASLDDYITEYKSKHREEPVFTVDGVCEDIEGAKKRIRQVASDPYDTLSNNCEHFAYYVLSGKPQSPQLMAVLASAALLTGCLLLGGRNKT